MNIKQCNSIGLLSGLHFDVEVFSWYLYKEWLTSVHLYFSFIFQILLQLHQNFLSKKENVIILHYGIGDGKVLINMLFLLTLKWFLILRMILSWP